MRKRKRRGRKKDEDQSKRMEGEMKGQEKRGQGAKQKNEDGGRETTRRERLEEEEVCKDGKEEGGKGKQNIETDMRGEKK